MFAILKKPAVTLGLVAVVALIWNGMVYALIREQLDPVAAQTLTDDYRHFIDIRPIWELTAAHITYIAGLIGAVLLVVQRKEAAWAFALSTVAAAITVISTFVLGPAIIGTIMLVVTIVAGLFTWFARRRFG